MRPKRLFWANLLILLIGQTKVAASDPDTSGLNQKQKWIIGAHTGVYIGGFTGLYQLWYADHNTGSFHFFNDNDEWGQMDKAGHIYGAYAESRYSSDLFEWSGFSKKRSVLMGSAYSLLFQTTVEVFDGFSEGWGASYGDIIANFAGTGTYLSQELIWDQQRISVKFSYRETKYPAYRPDLLGNNFVESIFKDYNGQTYWLSANVSSFLNEGSRFPEWLNIAFGYGIDGFISGDPLDHPDIFLKNSDIFPRMRIFYLSPDLNLEKINVRSKFLKMTFSILNNFKFPLPAVGFSDSGEFIFLPVGF